MTDFNICLQTAAAISSTIAAFAAVWVAKKTSSFQKNSLLKKALIEKILALQEQLYDLKSHLGQSALAVADEKLARPGKIISEAADSVRVLGFMLSDTASADLNKILDCVRRLQQEDFYSPSNSISNTAIKKKLDDAISALKTIYRAEIN
jgi:ABC-type multidrug transport system fused ATPase/permease subunit